MKTAAIAGCVILSAMSIQSAPAQPAGPPPATGEFLVSNADPGVQLYVRNKHPRGASRFSADNIVLFVHGATYPAETAFDLQLDGLSWMDYIASRGYDVYLV